MYRTDSMGGGVNIPSSPDPFAPEALTIPSRSLIQRVGKRALDVAAAVTFIALGLPLYIFISLAVKLTSPGPIHYWQYRLGRHGRRFRFYKFRSMYVDGDAMLTALLAKDAEADSTWRVYQKLENDPRITPFGRFIRRTSLDELPQFWNVLKGDMSLVGPRPCMEQQERFYGQHWGLYCSVKPGLTGLWQVSGRNRLSYSDRVELDARYVQQWSLLKDVQIVVRTFKAVLTGDGSQ